MFTAIHLYLYSIIAQLAAGVPTTNEQNIPWNYVQDLFGYSQSTFVAALYIWDILEMLHMMFSRRNWNYNKDRNHKPRLPSANIHKDVSPRFEIACFHWRHDYARSCPQCIARFWRTAIRVLSRHFH